MHVCMYVCMYVGVTCFGARRASPKAVAAILEVKRRDRLSFFHQLGPRPAKVGLSTKYLVLLEIAAKRGKLRQSAGRCGKLCKAAELR